MRYRQPPLTRSVAIGVISLAFMFASSQLAAPAYAEDAPPILVQEVMTEAADDSVSAAAADYTTGDPSSAAALAQAAASTDAVPLEHAAGGAMAETPSGTAVVVSSNGDVTLAAPGLPEVGFGVAGNADSVKVMDGAVVQTGIAQSADMVTRATEAGVQMVVVMGNDSAPNSVEFPIDLPKNSDLIGKSDGSVAVVAPIEVDTVDPTENSLFTASVEKIVGEATRADDLRIR